MKTKYSIEVKDLRHQSDQITPKTIQLFHDSGAVPEKANFCQIIIRRRGKELISDGNKFIEINVI